MEVKKIGVNQLIFVAMAREKLERRVDSNPPPRLKLGSKKRINCSKLLLLGKIKKYFPVHTSVHWHKELGMHMTKMNRLCQPFPSVSCRS